MILKKHFLFFNFYSFLPFVLNLLKYMNGVINESFKKNVRTLQQFQGERGKLYLRLV